MFQMNDEFDYVSGGCNVDFGKLWEAIAPKIVLKALHSTHVMKSGVGDQLRHLELETAEDLEVASIDQFTDCVQAQQWGGGGVEVTGPI